ncbi:hypothetical protein, partial [Pectobacterium polaris]|uniref:hypothetical protein n=1 Tax=Pectobacterium polaris TaxID=2042057 RepID=UPI001CF5567F
YKRQIHKLENIKIIYKRPIPPFGVRKNCSGFYSPLLLLFNPNFSSDNVPEFYGTWGCKKPLMVRERAVKDEV